MTRRELIERLAMAEGITLRAAETAVRCVFDSMAKALANGDRVEIRGFCSFKVKKYGSYKGRNPKTGKVISVKAKKLPVFKAGKELKGRVERKAD